MRINIYAEEMTNLVEIISKDIEGTKFTGLRFYLQLPATVARTAKSVCTGDLQQWAVSTTEGTCYLSPYHPGGPRSSSLSGRARVFARE